jgi:hypothetical protein
MPCGPLRSAGHRRFLNRGGFANQIIRDFGDRGRPSHVTLLVVSEADDLASPLFGVTLRLERELVAVSHEAGLVTCRVSSEFLPQ